MDWKDIAGTVAKAAPMLGTLLGGPAGGAVGGMIASALGTGSSPDEVARALASDPGAMVRLREIEADKAAKLEELAADQAKHALATAAADRANAREREVKTGDSITPRALAVGIVVGWFAIQAFLLQAVIPAEMREIIMRTLGTLDMALGLVLGYYFGSSASSRAKDELLSKRGP